MRSTIAALFQYGLEHIATIWSPAGHNTQMPVVDELENPVFDLGFAQTGLLHELVHDPPGSWG